MNTKYDFGFGPEPERGRIGFGPEPERGRIGFGPEPNELDSKYESFVFKNGRESELVDSTFPIHTNVNTDNYIKYNEKFDPCDARYKNEWTVYVNGSRCTVEEIINELLSQFKLDLIVKKIDALSNRVTKLESNSSISLSNKIKIINYEYYTEIEDENTTYVIKLFGDKWVIKKIVELNDSFVISYCSSNDNTNISLNDLLILYKGLKYLPLDDINM